MLLYSNVHHHIPKGGTMKDTPTDQYGRITIHDPESVTAWMSDGKCRIHPPAVFFPSDGAGVERAQAICNRCPVAERCLDYALEFRIEHGVWGGASERERRRILRRKKLDVASAEA
jgi:WhiB family redox-sensing transcriptional regulator